ncbi:uncharacterized protein PITG_06751 [Phytophthora infestans T30-4]|uniref:Uncharacterized protein n=1 Tax=Phytophthora infestans (strain T30-4) TaxID=403677 RepID=D0N807_PHYIT|nr:uncharacterized protein PITG_06751 [Phytophthora infestans T30-4]EEY53124.1 hypothetical protein PITG_06751 [Phytophthora infestans T30-4]|eukprot:XP_002904742.1 hypothetical protein PITG_06751 [Phytophthora infestans T30-4]
MDPSTAAGHRAVIQVGTPFGISKDLFGRDPSAVSPHSRRTNSVKVPENAQGSCHFRGNGPTSASTGLRQRVCAVQLKRNQASMFALIKITRQGQDLVPASDK